MAIQRKYLFSERLQKQLIWSRFVNTVGLVGHNIPLDLHLEHLNRYSMKIDCIKYSYVLKTLKSCTSKIYFQSLRVYRNLKEYISRLRAGKSEDAIVRVSKCLDVLMGVKETFSMGLREPSGLHSSANYKADLAQVTDELLEVKSFRPQPQTAGSQASKHTGMDDLKPLLHNVNRDKIQQWIIKSGNNFMLNHW